MNHDTNICSGELIAILDDLYEVCFTCRGIRRLNEDSWFQLEIKK